MRIFFSLIFFFCWVSAWSQIPLRLLLSETEKTMQLPASISSERSAVIVSVPDRIEEYRKIGNWQDLSEKAHDSFVKMGIDAILYVNGASMDACKNEKKKYISLFDQRRITNIIFLTKNAQGHEILIGKYNETPTLIDTSKPIFYLERREIHDLMLTTGKELRRADQKQENFLIPEKPNFVGGIPIVEKNLLKNYPGILRRTKLVVERFEKLEVTDANNLDQREWIGAYNQVIEDKNKIFEEIMTEYPYEYEFIDPMSEEDLLRRRYQFVLRSVKGQASLLREILSYKTIPSETDFVSTIPVMPDQTRAKPIPREAFVYKFYIRQNISKNIHVGVWDADVTWQEALQNMIRNLIQEHKVDK